jgi:hypothetical protein
MRTVLNGRGKPVVLTPENCDCDGWGWRSDKDRWEYMDWARAEFRLKNPLGFLDPHLRVPHKDGETAHRIRGKRWKITGLLPAQDRQP